MITLLLTSWTIEPSFAKTNPEKAIALWPAGAPGAIGIEPDDIPTLTPYLPPKGKANGAAFVVCPGGGYSHLAEHEGRDKRDWRRVETATIADGAVERTEVLWLNKACAEALDRDHLPLLAELV